MNTSSLPPAADRVRLRKNLLIVHALEDPAVADWLRRHAGQVFRLREIRGDAFFQSLGPELEACRTPVNITSRAAGVLRLISNFAPTPFDLDGLSYASVEGFWQSLKFDDPAKRRDVAMLSGAAAKDAGFPAGQPATIAYGDDVVVAGTWAHWHLMERACTAKFDQNREASSALLSTGQRPLTHAMKTDSRTIPGVVMAGIWMRCRARLRKAQA